MLAFSFSGNLTVHVNFCKLHCLIDYLCFCYNYSRKIRVKTTFSYGPHYITKNAVPVNWKSYNQIKMREANLRKSTAKHEFSETKYTGIVRHLCVRKSLLLYIFACKL